MKLAVREIEVDSIEQIGRKEIRERGKIVTLIIWVFLSILIVLGAKYLSTVACITAKLNHNTFYHLLLLYIRVSSLTIRLILFFQLDTLI